MECLKLAREIFFRILDVARDNTREIHLEYLKLKKSSRNLRIPWVCTRFLFKIIRATDRDLLTYSQNHWKGVSNTKISKNQNHFKSHMVWNPTIFRTDPLIFSKSGAKKASFKEIYLNISSSRKRKKFFWNMREGFHLKYQKLSRMIFSIQFNIGTSERWNIYFI